MLDDAANSPYDVSMLNAGAKSGEDLRQQMMLESNAAKAQVCRVCVSVFVRSHSKTSSFVDAVGSRASCRSCSTARIPMQTCSTLARQR
jgi:hypothetical protein